MTVSEGGDLKAWAKMTNDELIMHLELWLEFSDASVVLNDYQKNFFREVIFRLQLMDSGNEG
jgi:hypothetical protein